MIEKNTLYYTIVNKKDLLVNNTETEQARFVLKKMLGYFDLNMPEIDVSLTSKPFFKDSKIFFNYSHSKNYIACAISLSEVGIDIEENNRVISDLVAKKYLDSEENNFKRIEKWVKKESYSKLKGLGLQINFNSLEFENIKEENYFIKNEEYMCSIYCDSNNINFKELNLMGDYDLFKPY